MRKLMAVATLATTMLSAPALAQDPHGYLGIEGGILLSQDRPWAYSDDLVNLTDGYDLDLDTGYDIDAIGGYDFGMIRLEGEVAYKRASVKSATVAPAINCQASELSDPRKSRLIPPMSKSWRTLATPMPPPP